MRYVKARVEEYDREQAYRFFVSKSLQLIPQNKYININYIDFIHPKKEKPTFEIVAEIMNKACLKFED